MRLIIILSFGVTSETHYFAFIFLDVSTWIIGRHCKNFSPNTTCYSNFSDTLKNWPNLKPFVNLDSSISKTKNASTSSQSEDKAMLALFRQKVLVKTNFWVHLSLIFLYRRAFLIWIACSCICWSFSVVKNNRNNRIVGGFLMPRLGLLNVPGRTLASITFTDIAVTKTKQDGTLKQPLDWSKGTNSEINLGFNVLDFEERRTRRKIFESKESRAGRDLASSARNQGTWVQEANRRLQIWEGN